MSVVYTRRDCIKDYLENSPQVFLWGGYFRAYLCILLQFIPKLGVDPVQIIRFIYTVDAPRAGTIAVQPEGGHTADNIGITDEVRTARVAEAGAAGIGVIRQQQGEVAHQTAIDLD